MRNKTQWIAGAAGAAMLVSAIAVFGATHYRAVLHPADVVAQNVAANTGPQFPTIDQMCKAAGVPQAQWQSCVNDETSAAEFVGAWMQFNGFLNDGRIDIEQIQLSAELGAADHAIDPPAGDPLDPLDDALPEPGLPPQMPDVLGQLPGDEKANAAQTAMLCLTEASNDWLKMHDCIAHSDPSSTLDGAN